MRTAQYAAILLSLFAADALAADSKITEVTVFQDRASVKRRLPVKLRKGAHSLAFEGITPLIDPESLKARVTDRKLTILGLRNLPVFRSQSAKRELEDLRKRSRELESERAKIHEQVTLLIGQNQNLRLLADHYRDSFSVNLHQRVWEQKGFRSFVSFLVSQGSKLNSSWNKLYLRHEELTKELEFAHAKISEMSSASDRKTVTAWVDVIVDADVSAEVEIQYLVPGSGWSPAYDLFVLPGRKEARLEQGALVWQASGEDWSGVRLSLSNARTDLHTNPPEISAYTLAYREVKKVETSVGGQQEDVKTLAVNASMPEDPDEGGGRRPAEAGIARVFRIPGLRTVRGGPTKVKVPISERVLPYEEHLELVASQYPKVFRKAELANPFSWDLAPGPLAVFYEGAFQQQTWLEEVGRGGPFAVNTGVDHDIVVSRGQSEKIDEPGLIDRKRHFKREIQVNLRNFSSRPRQIKVLESHPVSQIKDIEVNVSAKPSKGQVQPGTEGWIYWNVEVQPKKWQVVELSLDVAVPKDLRFSW